MRCVRLLSSSFLLTALAGAVGPVRASASDPPGRIGRVSYLDGPVSERADTAADWSGALVNDVVTTGDALWTDAGAHAEVHVGSSAARLAPETLADFIEVSDTATEIRLSQGSLYLRLRQLGEGERYQIDTPGGTVALLEPGHYRIDVTPDGSRGTLTVRDGDARFDAGNTRITVWSGESAALEPGGAVTAALAPDQWEQWCAARDQSEDASPALEYVSPGFVGFESLDGYGQWVVDPSLGPIWYPTVVAGWAPYRMGHWGWVGPWGWTWVDDAPWGFVSTHYGRWAFVGTRWGWVPGAIVPTPVYAPALVAFVGGSGFDLSLSFGSAGGVAWFPLAPGEVYLPAYGVSPGYIRGINITSVRATSIDVTRIDVTHQRYANRAIPGALTAVPRQAFVGGAPVAKAAVRVTPRALAGATVIRPATLSRLRPVRPTAPGLTVARPPARAPSRPAVRPASTRTVPPAARPSPPPQPTAAIQHWPGPSDPTLLRRWQSERDQALAREAAERSAVERQQQGALRAPPSGVSVQALRQQQEQQREAIDSRHQAERESIDRRYHSRG
jgi:hypothetical protein